MASTPPNQKNSVGKLHHILVAEDDDLTAIAFEAYLESKGYRVTLVQNGMAAVAADLNDPADILLTNMRLPDMDGLALTDVLRTRQAALPAIVMTEPMMIAEVISAQPCSQPTAVLTKPIEPINLIRALRMFLRGRVAEEQDSDIAAEAAGNHVFSDRPR